MNIVIFRTKFSHGMMLSRVGNGNVRYMKESHRVLPNSYYRANYLDGTPVLRFE